MGCSVEGQRGSMTDLRKRVLVVDDEVAIRDSLKLLLKNNFEVGLAQDGVEALSVLDEFQPDLVLLDVMMPNLDGMQTLIQLREKGVSVPVIMLTAVNTVRNAVEAMKLGAVDYLNKPFDVEELTTRIVHTLDRPDKEALGRVVVGETKKAPNPAADFGPMVGKSQLMRDIFQRIEQVAGHDATVLITGESGTGKELVARQIHDLSKRKKGPFIAINCAAIPETLIESELFGHEKGAFTHAIEKRIGHFELANGGTLFLDEIGELSLPVQVKMLRFLQEHELYRVGRSKPISVDVRVMTATNKNLEELIKVNRFRQDLFYRINVINITIPPLRDRFEDIPELVKYFIRKLGPAYKDRRLIFGEEAMNTLVAYGWPGNVRELENVVESLMALCPSDTVGDEDLPRKVRMREGQQPMRLSAVDPTLSFEEAERLFESQMIVKALRKTNYVQTRAAEILGISRRILKYKMDKLGISDQPNQEQVQEAVKAE
jgi:DNA-binding NtrC family response regulator